MIATWMLYASLVGLFVSLAAHALDRAARAGGWATRFVWLVAMIATGMLWRHRRQWTAREIDGVPLFVTPNLGPAVVALPRSEILVPEWLLSLDPMQMSLVLRHEREHRAAGDPALLIAATLLRALVPWNPAIWWQMRRL